MRGGQRLSRLLSALSVCLLLAGQVLAQDGSAADPAPQILIVDRARLFSDSAFGKASMERERAEVDALGQENAGIQAKLVAEEQELTTLRKSMSAEEFSARAAAFDDKVERIRAEQDDKARKLALQRDEDVSTFQRAALPILGELMAERGALVLLDQAAVIVRHTSVDVTDEAIARIDAALSTGVLPPVAP